MAVLVLREWRTGPCNALTPFVQTVGYADGVVVGGRGVADPIWQRDGDDCADCGAEEDPEGDAVDDAAGHDGGGWERPYSRQVVHTSTVR